MILKKILSLLKLTAPRESASASPRDRKNTYVTLALIKKEKTELSKKQ